MHSRITALLAAESEDKIPYQVGAPLAPTAQEPGDDTITAALEIMRSRLRNRDVLSTPQEVKAYLCLRSASYGNAEVFSVLFLDVHNHVLSHDAMFFGTISHTSVHPREVVRRALAHGASAVIIAHNHPSGCVQPSRADEAMTKQLQAALGLIDVKVFDHLVVSGPDTFSFAERGLL